MSRPVNRALLRLYEIHLKTGCLHYARHCASDYACRLGGADPDDVNEGFDAIISGLKQRHDETKVKP